MCREIIHSLLPQLVVGMSDLCAESIPPLFPQRIAVDIHAILLILVFVQNSCHSPCYG